MGSSDVPRRIQSYTQIEDAKRDGFVDLGSDKGSTNGDRKKSGDPGQMFTQSILEEDDDFEILTTEESFEKDKKLLGDQISKLFKSEGITLDEKGYIISLMHN